ncbi:MAG: methyltransferase domain-containing protein, partial [Firmicutes bacterium]|nr:methyltransferase domain-containing protein [Bacillota bacterium]
AAERLYSDALALIPGIEGRTVYDLYCGTGTISQAMALKAKKVIGVEIVEEAVDAARANAAANGLDNCSFIAADVLTALYGKSDKPDVIV